MTDPMGSPRPSPRHKSEAGLVAHATSRMLRWWAENGGLLTGATHLPIPVEDRTRVRGRRKATPVRPST